MPEIIKEVAYKINTPKQENSKEETWQDKLSQLPKKNYVPAVQYFSMYFEVDTSAFEPKQRYYQLLISKNDVYSMFCLKQTLNLFNVQYSLVSTKDNTQIILDTDDKNILEGIIKKLKTYDIDTQIKEMWL
ncbi:hypothetical protein OLQ22_02070 [Campylobacter jejuni]|nr:hypothetical protein [Campylobacter jejuni]